MIIKNCFVVAASYPFFVGVRGNVTHFFRAWGNTTHFQNELKETPVGMEWDGKNFLCGPLGKGIEVCRDEEQSRHRNEISGDVWNLWPCVDLYTPKVLLWEIVRGTRPTLKLPPPPPTGNSIILSSNKIHIGNMRVPANPGPRGKRPLESSSYGSGR